MDEAVTLRFRAPATLAACMLLACAGAHADSLRDPTRPPASLASWTGNVNGAAADGGPKLQTILIGRGPGGRHLAVIDGQTVYLGDAIQGARVARIAENEVELVRGKERQVLHLYAQDAAGVTPVRPPTRR